MKEENKEKEREEMCFLYELRREYDHLEFLSR